MRKLFGKLSVLKWIAVVLLIGGLFIALLLTQPWRKEWIKPLPGIILKPSRPVIKAEDLQQDSAFDFLRRGAEEEDKAYHSPELSNEDLRRQFSAETTRFDLEPWSEEAFPATAKFLEKNQAAMELFRKAGQTANPRVPVTVSGTIPYISQTQQVFGLFVGSSAKKTSIGDFRGAYSDLAAIVDCAEIYTRGTAVIATVLATGTKLFATKHIRLIALQYPLPSDVAHGMIDRLEQWDKSLEPWASVLREESQRLPDVVDQLFDPGRNGIFGMPDWFQKRPGFVGMLVSSSRIQVRSDLESFYAHGIDLAEKPYDVQKIKALDDIFLTSRRGSYFWWKTRDPAGYFVAEEFSGFCITGIVIHNRSIVDLRATEIVLALRQFEQNEKRLPVTLRELVPDYLPSVPMDPFDGKPLKYQLKANGSWIVYSVGANQLDDGGMPSNNPARYQVAGDLVFPSSEAIDAKTKLAVEETKSKQ